MQTADTISRDDNATFAFGDWWSALNKELKVLNEAPALYADARYYHTRNYSPFGAANRIHEDRAEG